MSSVRRWVLAMGVAGGVAALGALPGWGAERGPIRVGFIAPFSGPFAQNAKDMWEGFRQYFDEVGMQAGGRKIELISEDSWVEPAEALTKLRKLVERDQVHVAAGSLLAPSSYALLPYVEAQRVPFLSPISCADDVTQRKIGRWFVRVGWSCSQTLHPFGEYAYKVLGFRKVVGLGFDFAFGHESVGGFQRVFEENGGRIIQKLWAPANVADFAPYLAQIKREADAVLGVFSGAAAIRLVKQYQEYGLTGRIALLGQGTLTDEHVLPSMGDEALGVVSALVYSATLDTPENRRFAQTFQRRANKSASYFAAMPYTAAKYIVEGIKAVGGDVENKERFLNALRAVQIGDDPRGPLVLDRWGNPDQNIYVRKVERVGGKLQNTVVHTYPNVSQFWTYKPEEFLKNPVYDREKFPGCRFCQ